MAEEHRSRLGRGLAALMGDMGDESAVVERVRGTGVRRSPTAFLSPAANNPRRSFPEEELDALTQSVREKGVLQPILVRALPGGERDRYEIVAGERRWRAAQRAGLHDVPVVVVEASDKEALEIALVENVQRTDLEPLDEAGGYQQLVEQFGYTQERLSQVLGKSRSHVANTLRLLGASEAIRRLLRDRLLTAGHARAIMNAPDADALAQRIVRENLSVREAEALAQEGREAPPAERGRAAKAPKDADTRRLEDSLRDSLGLKVVIAHRGDQGGKVEIRYRSLEQLDDVCRRLQA